MNAHIEQDLLKLVGQIKSPGVHHIRMTHATGCPAILSQNTGLCNCNPSIALSTEQQCIEALAQNRARRRAAEKAARKSNNKGAT